MNVMIPLAKTALRDLVRATSPKAATRFVEFFLSHHRNANTRKSYAYAARTFMYWCQSNGLTSLPEVEPLHVALYIEQLLDRLAAPPVKQHPAAVRALFDYLVVGQIVPTNPASSLRGPKHSVKRGRTPVLDPAEARQLLDSIESDTAIGLRDRALIGLMVYSFARVGAAVGTKVGDVYTQHKRLWVRLHEKGGKRHELPCHHNLETYLHAYFEGSGMSLDMKAPLFPTIGRGTGQLTPPAPSERVGHGHAPGRGCRLGNRHRQPYFPRNRHHCLSEERRNSREGRAHCKSLLYPHNPAL